MVYTNLVRSPLMTSRAERRAIALYSRVIIKSFNASLGDSRARGMDRFLSINREYALFKCSLCIKGFLIYWQVTMYQSV